jgi:hypothetical protein
VRSVSLELSEALSARLKYSELVETNRAALFFTPEAELLTVLLSVRLLVLWLSARVPLVSSSAHQLTRLVVPGLVGAPSGAAEVRVGTSAMPNNRLFHGYPPGIALITSCHSCPRYVSGPKLADTPYLLPSRIVVTFRT